MPPTGPMKTPPPMLPEGWLGPTLTVPERVAMELRPCTMIAPLPVPEVAPAMDRLLARLMPSRRRRRVKPVLLSDSMRIAPVPSAELFATTNVPPRTKVPPE